MKTNKQNKTGRIIAATILVICLVGFGLLLAACNQETNLVNTEQILPTVEDGSALSDVTASLPTNASGTVDAVTETFATNITPIHEMTDVPTISEAVVSTRAVDIEESKDLDAEVQELYEGEMNVSYYVVVAEIINPTFNQAFPEAQLYKVRTDAPTLDVNNPTFTLMSTYKGKNYRMPLDFNQLLFNVGYELNEENRDIFTHALIVVALPVEMVNQSVVCNAGYPIDNKDFGSGIHFTYAVDCQVDGVDVSAWFWKFEKQFNHGLITWGNLTEYGWRETGGEFTTYPARH